MTRIRRFIGIMAVTMLASCASVPLDTEAETQAHAVSETAVPETESDPEPELLVRSREAETLERAPAGDPEGEPEPTQLRSTPTAPSPPAREAPLLSYTPEDPLSDAIEPPPLPSLPLDVAYDEPAMPAMPELPQIARETTAITQTPEETPEPAPEETREPAVHEHPADRLQLREEPPAEPPAEPTAEPVEAPEITAPEEIHERIETNVSESVFVEVPGENWLYVPGADEALVLRARERSDGETVFEFRPEEEGVFIIDLQQQNLGSGTLETHRVEISAGPE
ncbi:MAG: hypothetical protein ACOC4F_02330, partial [bacterium]